MMYYSFNGFPPFQMFGFWFLFMALFWGLVIYGIILLIKQLSSGSQEHGARALEILKERYAKGEIKKEEFETMKKNIK